jgi:hypothetical protein
MCSKESLLVGPLDAARGFTTKLSAQNQAFKYHKTTNRYRSKTDPLIKPFILFLTRSIRSSLKFRLGWMKRGTHYRISDSLLAGSLRKSGMCGTAWASLTLSKRFPNSLRRRLPETMSIPQPRRDRPVSAVPSSPRSALGD